MDGRLQASEAWEAQGSRAAGPPPPPATTDRQPPLPHCQPPAASTNLFGTQQEGHFSLQLELMRLRRERDEAVAASAAELRRERDQAAGLRARLEALQAEHAALREQHATAALRAEQAAAKRAAEAEASALEAERLRAAHAQLAAERQGQALRLEALETKLAVLLDAFRALEAERPRPSSAGACTTLADTAAVAAAAPDPPLWLTGAPGSRELGPAEASAMPRSHLSLALRCAELQHSLVQARRQAAAAQAASAAGDEEVAGLRLLLARQQAAGGGGSAGSLARRLEGLARQLEEARQLGLGLRQQLTQASTCMRVLGRGRDSLKRGELTSTDPPARPPAERPGAAAGCCRPRPLAARPPGDAGVAAGAGCAAGQPAVLGRRAAALTGQPLRGRRIAGCVECCSGTWLELLHKA